MSQQTSYDGLRREMTDLLQQARRKVYAAAIRARLPGAVYRAMQGVTAVAGLYFLVRVAARTRGHDLPGWWSLAAYASLAVLIALGVALARALRRPPGLIEAAQRLDLAVCDHNRIAIALALLETRDESPFSQAAVLDGIEHLRRFRDFEPSVVQARWKHRQIGYLAALCGIFLVLSMFVAGPRSSSSLAENVPARGVIVDPRSGAPDRTEPPRPDIPPPAVTPQSSTPGTRDRQAPAARRESGVSPRNERATGKAGGSSAGESGQSNQSMDSLRDSGESAANSKFLERRQAQASKPKRSADTPRSQSKDAESPEENASINPGAAGGGAMSTARNEFSQRIENSQSDRDDEDYDAETEDLAEANTQRGGIQPLLKDRQAAPSRDLGITGDEGDPGNGRGGPSPPKKARGTASLVLGVPVPDFVRGRMGPGMTKITHERIEPAEMPGDPAVPAAAAAGVLPESRIPRFDVPPDVADLVRRYLINLHSADRKASPAPAWGAP